MIIVKTKVARKRVIKTRMIPKFPANVIGNIAVVVNKAGGQYTIQPDYSQLVELTTFDPTQELVLVYGRDGTWAIVPVSTLVHNPAAAQQVITSGATYAVQTNDSLVAVNKDVGSATTITLPPSASKNGAVRVVDFKSDSGTNNITVNVSGADKLNGNLTSWRIAGDGASILLTPISGIGYAVS